MTQYKQWYDRNKAEILERRRRKYAEDPAFRERALKRSSAQPKPTIKPGRTPKAHEVEFGGEKLQVFAIGALALLLNQAAVTIKKWERDGSLPVSPIRVGAHGVRQYTREMMDVVKRAVEARGGRVPMGDASMFEEVVTAWRALGFEGKRLEDDHGGAFGGVRGGGAAVREAGSGAGRSPA
jgi:hypothetical protein